MHEAADDTICAVATAAGEGGVGIVRISGSKALAVAGQVTRLRSGRSLKSLPSHTLYLADIGYPPAFSERQGEKGAHGGDRLDEGLVVYMAAPRSFTAEDVVELHCHGSTLLVSRVCAACLAAGARLAQPGEFTKRAFLNGRLDLSQAEAVLDTIRAKSEDGLRVAQRQLRGDLRLACERLRARLVELLAHVEAGIDFSEEDIDFIGRNELGTAIGETVTAIRGMLATAHAGRRLREGARVVIVGRPNVGKSSLLNALLHEERAIVTPLPGTTRDVLEETALLDGLAVTLMDTAGLRETSDEIEREGIRRAKAAQADADVVVEVLDASDSGEDNAVSLLPSDGADRLVILNKMDLVDEACAERLLGKVQRLTASPVIPASVRRGVGLADIRRALRTMIMPASLEVSQSVMVTNVRHQAALEQALGSLTEACAAIEQRMAPECVAVDIREAADALGEITGTITSADVLERIFSEFCIGK